MLEKCVWLELILRRIRKKNHQLINSESIGKVFIMSRDKNIRKKKKLLSSKRSVVFNIDCRGKEERKLFKFFFYFPMINNACVRF